MDAFTIPSRKNQDFAGTGRVDKVDYIFAFDGHGTDNVIQQIRYMNMDDIATSANPVQAVHDRLAGNTFRSGSTMAFARVTGTLIETFNCGDSELRVYVNDEPVHTSTPHTFTNLKEIQRTQHAVYAIKPVHAPFPVSDTVVRDVLSPLGCFTTGEDLVPSQSLGHNNMTGIAPECFTLTFKPTDHVRIVVGTDGFWDMLVDASSGHSRLLAEKAHRRWLQTWTYASEQGTVQTDFGGDIDDVGVAVYDNHIQARPSLCIPWSHSHFTVDEVAKTFEAVMGGVLRVDELVKPTHKVFFVHFIPAWMDDKNKYVYDTLTQRPLKVFYTKTWFWKVGLSHYTQPLRCADDVFYRWDGESDYQEFVDTHISAWSAYKMVNFTGQFR